jgi:hypothetical protein
VELDSTAVEMELERDAELELEEAAACDGERMIVSITVYMDVPEEMYGEVFIYEVLTLVKVIDKSEEIDAGDMLGKKYVVEDMSVDVYVLLPVDSVKSVEVEDVFKNPGGDNGAVDKVSELETIVEVSVLSMVFDELSSVVSSPLAKLLEETNSVDVICTSIIDALVNKELNPIICLKC